MLDWFSQNLAALVAILVSVGTLTFSNISQEATTTSNVLTRIDVLEKQVSVIPQIEDRTYQLETSSAVTNQILIELNNTTSELSENTQKLSKLVTKVAVIDQRLLNISEKVENINGVHE